MWTGLYNAILNKIGIGINMICWRGVQLTQIHAIPTISNYTNGKKGINET
jgi:hypothetical protein